MNVVIAEANRWAGSFIHQLYASEFGPDSTESCRWAVHPHSVWGESLRYIGSLIYFAKTKV